MANRWIPLESRFWSRVDRLDEEQCWLWTGRVWPNQKGRNPRGLISVGGKTRRAHRVSYELANGPIAEGMDVLHRCGTDLCVNPSHLYLGTDKENAADRDRHGRTARGDKNSNHVARLERERLRIENAQLVAEVERLTAENESLARGFRVATKP